PPPLPRLIAPPGDETRAPPAAAYSQRLAWSGAGGQAPQGGRRLRPTSRSWPRDQARSPGLPPPGPARAGDRRRRWRARGGPRPQENSPPARWVSVWLTARCERGRAARGARP